MTTQASSEPIAVTIASEKGGQAKTTTTANLTTMLRIMGPRVLALDCDPQGGLTFSFGINRDRLKNTLYEALLSEVRETQDVTLQEVILQTWYNPETKGFIDPTEHIDPNDDSSPTVVEDLLAKGVKLVKGPHLAPISRNSLRADQELQAANPLSWFYSLRDALQPVLPYFDYIVADTNPSAGCLTALCLCTFPHFVIPLTPEALSVQGMFNLLKTVRDAKRVANPNLQLAGILFTKVFNYKGFDSNMETLQQDPQGLLKRRFEELHLKYQFFETAIQQCRDGVDAADARSVAVLHRPNTQHAIAYWCFLAELLNIIGGPARPKMPEVLRAIQAEEERRAEATRARREGTNAS